MVLGPTTLNASPYLPLDYNGSAFPKYPKVATHKTISTETGLHTGPAVREVSKGADQDLNDKKELVDKLPSDTQIIVFNEACGYKGQWAQVLVIGANGFYKYTDSIGEEVERLFVMREHLQKLPGTKQSHPIVKPTEIDTPMYDILPSNWRNEPAEIPFFDNRTNNYCIIVERLASNEGVLVFTQEEPNFEYVKRSALEKGIKLLLDYYQKDYPSNLLDFQRSTSSTLSYEDLALQSQVAEGYEAYFSFARAEEFHVEPRTYDSVMKFLIQIPQIYFDTYGIKETSQPIVETFLEGKKNVNKFLDQNDGLINTNVLRDLVRSGIEDENGELPDWMLNQDKTVEIFGEEYVYHSENAVARTLFSPEEIARESQARRDTFNEAIGDIPEHLYNRLVPGEAREAIEATLKGIRDAYETTEGVAGDVTEGLQATIDTINLVTDTLDAAPDIDSVNDAMFRAFQDPTVDIANISDTVMYGTGENEAQKRRYQDRNLSDILPLLENTLILERWNNLLQLKLANDNVVAFYSGSIAFDESATEASYMYGGGRPIPPTPPIPPDPPPFFEVDADRQGQGSGAMTEYEEELEEYDELEFLYHQDYFEYERKQAAYERGQLATTQRGASAQSRKERAIKKRDEAIKAVDELESVIKQTEFYVQLTGEEFKDGTTKWLPMILEALNKQKDQFDGDVEGWMPKVDAEQIKKVYGVVTEFIAEQGRAASKADLHGYWQRHWHLFEKDFPKKNTEGEQNFIEFGFTKNHRLVYIGCRFYPHPSRKSKKAVTFHHYGTGQPINFDFESPNPLNWGFSFGGVFEGFDNFVRKTPPLESETIMAYIWKLNEILQDPLSEGAVGWFGEDETLPVLTDWGSKYVFPRPTFIAKPKQLTDVTKQRRELGKELTKLKANEDRDLREDGQLRIKQAIQAVNDLEYFVDSTVGDANAIVKDINSADDAINNFFAAHAAVNPYAAAAVKCLVPKLDFDLLPEIPDLDLEWLRNPLMKVLELWEQIVPPGDIWDAIRKGLERALEQALKLAYVTLVKLLLEMLAAACLQAQAAMLAGALALADAALDLIKPENKNPSPEDVISNLGTAKEAAIIGALNEVGIFKIEHFNMAEAIGHAKNLFSDVSGLLSPVEFCQLISGDPPEYILSLIINLIAVKHRHFIDVIDSRSKIIELFSVFGKYVDQKVCNEIISGHESRTIFSDNYKNLHCNISSELDRVRKELLACNPNLTQKEIDDIIARENKANLEAVKALIDGFKSNSFDFLSNLNIESAAADHAMAVTIETLFQAASNELKEELKEYSEYLRKISEFAMPSNADGSQGATVTEVLNGTRPMSEMPQPTEIAGFLKKNLEELETKGNANIFRILDSNNGFTIRMLSPWWSGNDLSIEAAAEFYNLEDLEQSFEMQFQLHNKVPPAGSVALTAFTNQATSAMRPSPLKTLPNSAILPWEIPDRYSLIVKNTKTNENTFMYSKLYDLKEGTKDYIEQNIIPNINSLTSDNSLAPQQVYFQTFMESKLGKNIFSHEADRQNFKLFAQHGIFSQVILDVVGFLGREIASSKFFEFSGQMKNSKLLSELDVLDLPSKANELFGIEKIKSEAISRIKKNQSKDLPEPSDATEQRKHFHAFEVGVIEQCIKSIIRVYIIEFLVKSIFSSSTFVLSEKIDEIFQDYILQKLISDLPTIPWSSKIFNYKFTYLARGIHQDSLERPPNGDDHDIDYILTKYIIEEYTDVRKIFNELVVETATAEDIENLTSGLQGVSAGLASLGNLNFGNISLDSRASESQQADVELIDNISASTATRKFLDQLVVRDYAGRNFEWVQDFTGEDGSLDESKLKNGNFYFERYIKITKKDGTVHHRSPEVLMGLRRSVAEESLVPEDISSISYNLKLIYLFPYGNIQTIADENPVKLTSPTGVGSSDAKYSLNVSSVLQNAENIEVYNYQPQRIETTEGEYSTHFEPIDLLFGIPLVGTTYNPPVDTLIEEVHYQKNLPLVTIANVEQNYNGRIEDWFTSYNVFSGLRADHDHRFVEKLVDETYDGENYWALDSMNDDGSGGGRSRDGKTNARSLFFTALKNKINIIANTTEKREILAKYWEENTLGIGVMVHDSAGNDDKYWCTRGMSSHWDINKARTKQANKSGGTKSLSWDFKKDPNEEIEEYIFRHLSAFFKAYKKWLKKSDQEGYDIDIERIRAYAVLPFIEGEAVGTQFPDANLHEMINKDKDVNFLFNYIFPIEKYKTLMSIYIVESMGDIPGLDMMFSGTKLELRSIFNTMDSRGKFDYVDRSKEGYIDNIKRMKDAMVTPAPTRAFIESEDAREERRENVNQTVATTSVAVTGTLGYTTTIGGYGGPQSEPR